MSMTAKERANLLRDKINNPDSYKDLPQTMDTRDCVSAKFWPVAWLTEALRAHANAVLERAAQTVWKLAGENAITMMDAIRALREEE